MRLALSSVLLVTVGVALTLDFVRPAPEWKVCALGLCRTDQLPTKAAFNPKTTSLREMTLALRRDPADPALWAQCGEILDSQGDTTGADHYFRRALELGPNITPGLMDAVNHNLIANHMDEAFKAGSRVLSLTPDFDPVLFGLYDALGPPVPTLLGTVIPTERRAASAYMRWLITHGSEEDLMATWKWVDQNHFGDNKLAGQFAWQLWNRGSTHEAARIWAAWLGQRRGDFLQPDLLANRRFASEFLESPFDWRLDPYASVKAIRKDGLEFTFAGTENVNFMSMYQLPAVSPGSYRFSAVVESRELTTKQCPQFRIYNPQEPQGRVNVATPPICGSTPRHTVEVVFAVPPGVNTLAVRLERLQSDRIDNKISGTLKVHEVSLRPQ